MQPKPDEVPMLLAARLAQHGDQPAARGRVMAWPHHWQVPAATEKAAFEAMLPWAYSLDFDYIGFAWATLFDGLRNDAATNARMLRALAAIRAQMTGRRGRRVSVAQHIHSHRLIGFFQACGLTDLFYAHARLDQPRIGGIRIHPFPLFPAQTPEGPEPGDLHRPRRWLANFIGAYNPRAYLSDVRAHIFADAGQPDLCIVARDAWHFERAVYAEQMRHLAPDAARLALEAEHKAEYLDAIRDAAFTLCPTGSGPNSIRVGEALALGSVPIILTRDLALPGDPAVWEAACLFEDDSAAGYARALARARAMPAAELRARQVATQPLFAMIGPPAYGDLIENRMAAIAR